MRSSDVHVDIELVAGKDPRFPTDVLSGVFIYPQDSSDCSFAFYATEHLLSPFVDPPVPILQEAWLQPRRIGILHFGDEEIRVRFSVLIHLPLIDFLVHLKLLEYRCEKAPSTFSEFWENPDLLRSLELRELWNLFVPQSGGDA